MAKSKTTKAVMMAIKIRVEPAMQIARAPAQGPFVAMGKSVLKRNCVMMATRIAVALAMKRAQGRRF